MPTFGWRWLVALSSGPSFIVLLLYGLVPESPRFLCMKGRTNEARNILEKAASLNRTALQTGTLVSDHMQDDNNEFAASENTPLLSPRMDQTDKYKGSPSSLFVLFSRKLIRTNLLLWFLYFGNTFSYYGIVLLTSELSSDQSKCTTITLHSENSQNASLYIDVFVTSLAGNNETDVIRSLTVLLLVFLQDQADFKFSFRGSWPNLWSLHCRQSGSQAFHCNHARVSFDPTYSAVDPSE